MKGKRLLLLEEKGKVSFWKRNSELEELELTLLTIIIVSEFGDKLASIGEYITFIQFSSWITEN